MVAYLKKLEGSEEFHQIVYFLNASHIRHLQLADVDGISSLPTTEIFKQISLMGASKGYTGENIPLFPTMIVQGKGSTHPTLVADEVVHKERGDNMEKAATTATSLNVEQCNGNINRTQSTAIPNDPFPQGIGSGGSPRGQDTILGDRPAQTRLIKKVKKLEKIVKSSQARRRAKIVVFDDEDDLEDPSKQGRKIAANDQDPGISLVQQYSEIQGRYEHDMEFDFYFDAAKEVSTAEKDVSTVSLTRNTRVPTADDITMAETMVHIRKSAVKDKGKGKMDESKTIQTKTKLQQEQERLGFEAAVRLQAELEEEERQRIAMRLQAEERERGGYTLQQLRGYSFDEIKTLLETTMRSLNTFVPIESEVDRAVPELVAGSSKRDAEKNLIKKVLRGKRLMKAHN
ncbi:hypothetical protein Tco_1362441 [Tanacetum coccineum]